MTAAEGAESPETELMAFEPTRGLRYAELFAVGPELITVYNSIGLSEAPPPVWDALDAEAAAPQLGVKTVIKNGPHWWASDKATLCFGTEVVSVAGIGFRYAAQLPALIASSGKLEPPVYTVLQANKEGELVYSAGESVYELVSPDGEALVMQSSNVEPSEFANLGERLSPAAGWQFRTRTLEHELTVELNGAVRTAMDDLHNVYNLPPKAS